MSTNDEPPRPAVFFTSEFKRNVRQLAKKYRHSTRGKSGGYRVIYQKTSDANIVLITLYSKSEQSDIAPAEIRAIITAYQQENS